MLFSTSRLLLSTTANSNLRHLSSLYRFSAAFPAEQRARFAQDMPVIEDFVTVEEEERLVKEVEPYLKRLVYEQDHWDDVS